VRLVLALDAGTSSVRALTFDPSLSPVDLAQRPLTQHYPAPGLVEHDANEIALLANEVLTEVAFAAAGRGDDIVALGLTSQRETTVAFDRLGGDVTHLAIVWQDRRTAAMCRELEASGHLPLVRARTGLVLDPYFSGTKMRWLIDHGALNGARLPALATIDTFLLWWLTGADADATFATEPSNAARTMLYDLAEGEWSDELADLLGVPTSALAEIRPSVGPFGTVAANSVPALAGVPITGVIGDQQGALFGQSCTQIGMVKATYGTGAFVLVNAGPSPPTVPDGLLGTVAWDLGTHEGRTFALEGAAFVAGAAVQWLRDELGFISRAEDVAALAAQVPDAGGVVFIPGFTGLGSPFWRPDARGALLGLTRGSRAAHVARAVLDAQAYQVRAITDAFRDAGVSLRELRADGGLAAVDDVLTLQATLSRLDVHRGTSLEATARGAAALAGLSAGVWRSIDELATTWRGDFVATPLDATAADLGFEAWRRGVDRAS
jgi:glycerol kinase